MKKSVYIVLTLVAAFAALFFLGYWMGWGITLPLSEEGAEEA